LVKPFVQLLFLQLSHSLSTAPHTQLHAMILDKIDLLNSKRIVLASGSPRRKEILSSLV